MVFELPPIGPKIGIYGISPNIKKLSTGDKKLDIFLEGGLNIQSNNLLIGSQGEEKQIFLLQFIAEGLNQGEPSILITTDKIPEEIEKLAKKFNWDFKKKEEINLFKIIDCYSWTLGKDIPFHRKDILIQGPNSLNDLSITLSKLISEMSRQNKPMRIVFNSLSTFLLYNEEDTIFKFIQIMGARLKTMGATTLFLIEEGMHTEKTVKTLKHLTDETIQIKKINKKPFLDKENLKEPLELKIKTEGITTV